MLSFCRFIESFIVFIFLVLLSSCESKTSTVFYVDPVKGNDHYKGNIEKPFQTIDKALEIVKERVEEGILSDTIYLRGGIYKKNSDKTLYHFNLKGTSEHYGVFSAMPCDSIVPGAVKRKSGQWYEKVIFDDAWIISTPWVKTKKNSQVWQTSPGYTHLEWTHQNLWPWTVHGFPLTKNDDTPETTEFTVAPYMLLQNGKPSIWVNSLRDLKEPGQHFYNHDTKTLYYWPLENKNPNQCKIETWYGAYENYESGTLHLDGEGRALFDGNLQYATIKGFEFRMFNKLFEFHRRIYNSESERVIQHDVKFEDNLCKYGWIQILLDANTVLSNQPGVIRPKYNDRAKWIVRNNIFYRPSREVCQLHGDDHIFEDNVIIDHLGPWAGPAACVSAINTRNTKNFLVRHNYIVGQGNNKFHSGSVFMIESDTEHADKNGDYILGGQMYENNLIANVTSGAVFVLGKGGARMKNITIRNNIIKTNKNSPAIILGSPQQKLTIAGNIFYDQKKIIQVGQFHSKLTFDSMPSTIEIYNNLFVKNQILFDEEQLNTFERTRINIHNNLFYNNGENSLGYDIVTENPQFANPEKFDFTHPNLKLQNSNKYSSPLDSQNKTRSWQNYYSKFPSEVK